MSRLGKKPVEVPSGVTVSVSSRRLEVSGKLGKLHWDLPSAIDVTTTDDQKSASVTTSINTKQARALHGLGRALLANMVTGVTKGFERRLLIFGTGYSCNVVANKLHLNCGFMGRGTKEKPQFALPIPEGVEVVIEVASARGDAEPAKMLVKGCDKQKVGQFAAVVRKIRPPEPYKGKGIRYDDEHVRRKQGKALAGGR